MPLSPNFPASMNPITLFGFILVLGLIGGELAGRSRFLPRITGYIAVGFLVGPGGFNIMDASVLETSRIFVEISLSLILFDLGRHLDFTWLRHDKGLLPTAMTESFLTFVSVFFIIYSLLGLAWLPSALAAAIAVATSPAVVMMVIHDLSSDGPVTRRTLILTSLNNLFALIVFTLLIPLTQAKESIFQIVSLGAYHLLGSIMLGCGLYVLLEKLAKLIGKHRENQFVLFVGVVVLTIGFAHTLHLSSMLSLFMLGVTARNFDFSHALMEVDFAWLARLFFILLFVITGVHLQLQGLWQTGGIILFILIARLAAKTIGILLWSGKSGLTTRQSISMGFTLLPMDVVAIGMANILVAFNPDFGKELLLIVAGVVAVLNIIGPIVTQIAFIKTGEAELDKINVEATS